MNLQYPCLAAFRFVRETANAAKAAAPTDEGTRTDAAKRSASPVRRRALMKSTHFGGFCYPDFSLTLTNAAVREILPPPLPA